MKLKTIGIFIVSLAIGISAISMILGSEEDLSKLKAESVNQHNSQDEEIAINIPTSNFSLVKDDDVVEYSKMENRTKEDEYDIIVKLVVYDYKVYVNGIEDKNFGAKVRKLDL